MAVRPSDRVRFGVPMRDNMVMASPVQHVMNVLGRNHRPKTDHDREGDR
jgi:hypothetical protein